MEVAVAVAVTVAAVASPGTNDSSVLSKDEKEEDSCHGGSSSNGN